jgi:hypothetical protein
MRPTRPPSTGLVGMGRKMPFDLNRSRRRREIEIAKEVVAEIAKCASPPLEVIGKVLVGVCERWGVVLDVASGKRILSYASKEIDRRQRIVDALTVSAEAMAR